MRNKHGLVASCVHRVGIERVTWECAQVQNGAHKLLVHGTALQPTEAPGRGASRVSVSEVSRALGPQGCQGLHPPGGTHVFQSPAAEGG